MNRESPESPIIKLVDMSPASELATAIQQSELIGVDTEFMREKTFFSQLCLIQVSTGETTYCADPLAELQNDDSRAAFWQNADGYAVGAALRGRQDIEVVYQGVRPDACGRFLTRRFAAALLGYQPQIGYGGTGRPSLFCDRAGEVAHHARTGRARPLPAEFSRVCRARCPIICCPPATCWPKRLERLGRLAWAEEDSAALLDPALYAF